MRPILLTSLGMLSLAACDRQAAKVTHPAPGVAQTLYYCDDGRTVKASYVDQAAALDVDGGPYALKTATSGSGARYVGEGVQWWTKGMDRGRLAKLKAGEDVAADPGVNCSTMEAVVTPPEPGQPGGLPDDRTPLSEAPFTPTSAQGAADVVQTYYALIGEGKVAETARLRTDGQPQDLSAYASYHALVGGPGESEGAAGSIYIEVPVVIYGRLKAGPELHQMGKVTLKRVNDVDGATADQLRWRITKIDLALSPGPK